VSHVFTQRWVPTSRPQCAYRLHVWWLLICKASKLEIPHKRGTPASDWQHPPWCETMLLFQYCTVIYVGRQIFYLLRLVWCCTILACILPFQLVKCKTLIRCCIVTWTYIKIHAYQNLLWAHFSGHPIPPKGLLSCFQA